MMELSSIRNSVMPMPTSLPRLPEHLEAQLLRFDASWNKPDVEQLRGAYPTEANEAYLLELIHIDAQKRVAAGMAADEALYLEAFPMLQKNAAMLPKVREIVFVPIQSGVSILRALAANTPVLQQVNLPAIDPQTPITESPSTLPEYRYKLEGEIARGGMGAVLRGRDEDLGREIAVKVMLQNHAGKTELLQRFVEEAQIAGQLQHPGITPVYELGRFPDQRPYFTMKLVRGETLAKLLKDRSDPSSERPRFLKIFEQICQTLAYAHTRKVIHRDLKPHNIMVGSFGEVQVMDWGLAKVLTTPSERGAVPSLTPDIPEASEGSVQTKRSSGNSTDIPNTQTGSVLGTPAYMAPEQAKGDIDQLDERADVFGLGAILCEILTGKPPYVGESGFDIYRQAVDAEHADAMKRLDQCGADRELVSLAKQCLSVNREDRPRDASELTKNLATYLHSVEDRLKQAELSAVQAKTQAEEERKRRRITFRLAAAILLTLLAGLVASAWQMRRAMKAEELAIDERDKKEVQRVKAERRMKQIEKGVDLFAGMLKGINPRSEGKDDEPLYKQLMRRAEKAADQLDGDSIGDPVEVARLQCILGNTLADLGNVPKAQDILQRALSTMKKELGDNHVDTALAMNHLASAYWSNGRLAESVSLFETLKENQLKLLPLESESRHMILNNMAIAYKDAGQFNKAIQIFEQLRKREAQHPPADPAVPYTTMANLAASYLAAGRLSDAMTLYEKTRDFMIARLATNHRDTLTTLGNMATALELTGKPEESIELRKQVHQSMCKKLGEDHPDTLTCLSNLAGSYQAVGDMPLAYQTLHQVKEAQEKKIGPEHPNTLITLNTLALIHYRSGKLQEATKLFQQVSDAQQKVLDKDHPDLLMTQANLARAYRAANKIPQAIALFEQVRDLQIRVLGIHHPSTLATLNNLAGAYRAVNRVDDAIKLLEQVRNSQEAQFVADHPDTLTTIGNLAGGYRAAKRLPEAIALMERAAQGIERRNYLHPFAGRILEDTISNYELARQYEKAETWRRKWLAVVKKQVGTQHVSYANQLISLGDNLMLQQNWSEAEPFLREALAIRQKNDPLLWSTFNTMSMLGESLLGQKKFQEAETILIAGYEGMIHRESQIPTTSKRRLPEALDRLIQLYTETNKPDEVKKWQAEKLKLSKASEKKP